MMTLKSRSPFVIVLGLCLVCVQSVAAQNDPSVGVRGFVATSSQTFAAADAFTAVFGDDHGIFMGGGGQFRWKHILLEVSASRFTRSGERVFVSDGQVFGLGIPTAVKITPIEFTGAWRFGAVWRLRPYAGAGFGVQRYKESSQFAAASEDITRVDRSYHVGGGAEMPLWRWIAVSGEVRHRTVPGAIGEGGASRDYGERDLGGTSVTFRVLVIAR